MGRKIIKGRIEQCLQDTRRHLHMKIQRICDNMYTVCRALSQIKTSTWREGGEHEILFLMNGLLVFDCCQSRRGRFFLFFFFFSFAIGVRTGTLTIIQGRLYGKNRQPTKIGLGMF